MPELPDVDVYVERLEERIANTPLVELKILSPFVLRTFEVPAREFANKKVNRISRLGKRIVLEFENELFAVIHLMIAGRLQFKEQGQKSGLAHFIFSSGTLTLTENATKKRASIHLVRGQSQLEQFNRGGLEPLEATKKQFFEALRKENHTLKRTLTDPRIFSGIGNAYSDEILHHAKLAPTALSQSLKDADAERLFHSTRDRLTFFRALLSAESKGKWPTHVTAFRPEMAVHGKYGEPCPECGSKVQRIRHAENETNYCPACQTDGKLLKDRSLSRLLKDDWPTSIDEFDAYLEARKIR